MSLDTLSAVTVWIQAYLTAWCNFQLCLHWGPSTRHPKGRHFFCQATPFSTSLQIIPCWNPIVLGISGSDEQSLVQETRVSGNSTWFEHQIRPCTWNNRTLRLIDGLGFSWMSVFYLVSLHACTYDGLTCFRSFKTWRQKCSCVCGWFWQVLPKSSS